MESHLLLEVQAGFEPADNGVADRGLTTWLLHQIFDCLNIIAEVSRFVKRIFEFIFIFGGRPMVAPTTVAFLFSIGAHIVRPFFVALHSSVGAGAHDSER